MPAPSYIFVLCPPFAGSTILWKLVCTSPQVSAFETEGQFLPGVRELMRVTPWRARRLLPWEEIKAEWHRHWDENKPFLLEKSPPNLVRARQIAGHFDPAYFLIMARDPYAHCESLMRRSGLDARDAATFSLRLLTAQADNAAHLPRSLTLTYEELIDHTAQACAKIQGFLPALGALDPGAGGYAAALGGLVNLNAAKIAGLSAADLAVMGEVFSTRRDVLAFWGYELRPA